MLGRPPYAQSQRKGTYRNPFAFPAGVMPGVDQSHPAAASSSVKLFSGVAMAGGFVSLTTGKAGTASGTLTTTIKGAIGAGVGASSAAARYTFSGTTTEGDITQAAIFQTNTSAPSGTGCLISTSSGTNGGHRISANGTSIVGTLGNVANITSTLPALQASTPYFVAWTHKSGTTNYYFVLVNLLTGAISESTVTTTAWSPVSGDGTIAVLNDFNNDATGYSTAAVMSSQTSITKSQLRAWAADPWTFWYPDPIRLDYAKSNTVSITGTLVATDGADIAAFAGTLNESGTLAATDTADIAAFAGSLNESGTLTATDGADVAAFAGELDYTGTLVATDGADTAAFAGLVIDPITGTLAATDSPDTAIFVGFIPTVGTLAATDDPDIAAFTGTSIYDVNNQLLTIDAVVDWGQSWRDVMGWWGKRKGKRGSTMGSPTPPQFKHRDD